jgi:hypothetical protein
MIFLGVNMKYLGLLFISALLMLGLNSCSDTTNPEGTTKVSFQGDLSQNTVSATSTSKSNISASTVQSLTINRVRILVKEIKVTINDVDNSVDDDKYKTGPYVIDAVYPLSPDFADYTLPVGEIKKVKFEFHRFSSSQLATYASNPVFGPFATADRYSVIIEGKVTVDGVESNFTYNSDVTANLSLNPEKLAKLEENKDAILAIAIDPTVVFKNGSEILDPRDSKNESYIDNQIKSALKLKFKLK